MLCQVAPLDGAPVRKRRPGLLRILIGVVGELDQWRTDAVAEERNNELKIAVSRGSAVR